MYKIPQKNKTNKTRKLSGFTLVELIVVITILVILWTIAFINLWWFAGSARDSARISNLTNLKKWLDIFQIKSGTYPMPENSITLMMSWGNIAFQGFAKDQIGSISKMSPGGTLDPSDRTMYTTYTTTADRKKMQLMTFLEDRSSILSILTPPTYADTSTDYSKRYSYATGDKIGILLSSGTLSPVQETIAGSIDLATTSTGYIVYFDNKTTGIGTGTVLQTAFVGNSVVYTVANSNTVNSGFITATGGVITTVGNYKVHTFTTVGTGTFQVLSGTGNVEYLVVAGGGGGGRDTTNANSCGGGGGGGLVYQTGRAVNIGSYLVFVGWGGIGGTSNAVRGSNGVNSIFDIITAFGGGGGASYSNTTGLDGGSGGGSTAGSTAGISTQSNSWGGVGYWNMGSVGPSSAISGAWGGWGAGTPALLYYNGGDGRQYYISGIGIYYAGGWGGRAISNGSLGIGGLGGGGAMANTGVPGNVNSGWGGGWGGWGGAGGNGGSGIVIVRYQFQ